MNRKMRRAAARGKVQQQPRGPAGATGSDEIAQLFQIASVHQRAGRAADAARIYDRILATNPVHAESLQNLGVIALQAGKYDMAAGLFRRALVQNDLSPDLHYNIATSLYRSGRNDEAIAHASRALALKSDYVGARLVLGDALQRTGKRDDAMTCYARAIADAPDNARANANLAVLMTEKGRLAEARRHFERALASDPDNAFTHLHSGNLYYEQGDLERAIDCYLRAMELKPDLLDAHANFCVVLLGLSKFDAVIEYYEQFLTIKPDFVPAYNHLATAYNAAGNAARALQIVRQGFAISETDNGKLAFVFSLRNLRTAPAENLRDMLVRAVTEHWTRPNDLAAHCSTFVFAEGAINRCIDRAVAAWPNSLPASRLFDPEGWTATSKDKALRALLEHARVPNLPLERFVTAIRSTLLERATASPDAALEEDALAFYCALARQCFITEYVFLQTEEETARAHAVRDALNAALRTNAPVSALQVAAVASYLPLHSLAEGARLLERAWPQPVDALLTQQIREPAEERRLRAAISVLTPIEDAVSIAVRTQYEENPYPRWVSPTTIGKRYPLNLYLRTSLPRATFRHRRIDGPVDILFAGCGTGQDVLDLAHSIADARILAVDLSLTSMSYAKRQLRAIGIDNVEFGHADILKLGSLGRSFDVVASGGVLHHLADPEAGWRILLSLLNPDGFMRVALYSELARAEYVTVQKLIVERGYGRSADEIRRFRRDFIADEANPAYRAVLGCRDFYSVSECRDLLFHVQEHRMTIPRLSTFFAANNLRFMGFSVERAVQDQYARRFPDDPAATDLDNWHRFELENPRTFIGMYQFWVQKVGPESPTV